MEIYFCILMDMTIINVETINLINDNLLKNNQISNITKEDILKEIHYNLGIPINYSSKILDTLLELVTEGLNKDNKVKYLI